jgi:hypothetical protein
LVSATGNITNGVANVLTGNAIVTTLVQAARVSATGNVNATGNISGGNIAITGNASAATAAADTNTTQLATTAYVIAQASATTPTSIGTNTVGTSTRYARADHTHTGVTSVNGSSGAVTGIATTAGNISQFAATTSAQLAGVISDETGTGSLVFASTPTLVTPVIGAATGTSLSVTGAITVNSGSAVTAIVNGGTAGVGNIGVSALAGFNTVFAKATSAQYADLAENYSADAVYEPGTVLEFGGENEVTLSVTAGSSRIAGVVSTNPAYLMNSMLDTKHVAALALTGRVPTRVTGPVRKGDMMVSAGNGQACASAVPALGSVIGKALVNFDGSQGIIEIVVGRM